MTSFLTVILSDISFILLLLSVLSDLYLFYKLISASKYRKNSTSLILANINLNRAIFNSISLAGFLYFDSNYCVKLFTQFISVCAVILFTLLLVVVWLIKRNSSSDIRPYYVITIVMFYVTVLVIAYQSFVLPCDYVSVLPDFLETFVFCLEVLLIVIVGVVDVCFVTNAPKRVNVEIYLVNFMAVYFVLNLINGFLISVFEPVREDVLSTFAVIIASTETVSIFMLKFVRENEICFVHKPYNIIEYANDV